MELKRSSQICRSEGTFGLNRTFMELKQQGAQGMRIPVKRLNRTFMELKLPCSNV